MSQSYTAQGFIHSIGQTMEVGLNGFIKREFVIKLSGDGENPEYPNYVALSLIKDKCMMMDQYQIGQEIKVHFNLGGRLWAGNGNGEKCFVDLGAWKIEPLGQPQYAPQQPMQQPMQAAPQMAQQPMQQAPQIAPQQMAPQGQPMQPQAAPFNPNAPQDTSDIPW